MLWIIAVMLILSGLMYADKNSLICRIIVSLNKDICSCTKSIANFKWSCSCQVVLLVETNGFNLLVLSQDMIKCIGGFEVFIPHLERIGKEEVSSSKLFESDISFDSSTRKGHHLSH